jgi:hypothetical protein
MVDAPPWLGHSDFVSGKCLVTGCSHCSSPRESMIESVVGAWGVEVGDHRWASCRRGVVGAAAWVLPGGRWPYGRLMRFEWMRLDLG